MNQSRVTDKAEALCTRSCQRMPVTRDICSRASLALSSDTFFNNCWENRNACPWITALLQDERHYGKTFLL